MVELEEKNKELVQHSISDQMNKREEVEELYGKGIFYSYITKDIAKLLGIQNSKTEGKIGDMLLTCESRMSNQWTMLQVQQKIPF